jgi:hypothetical protein
MARRKKSKTVCIEPSMQTLIISPCAAEPILGPQPAVGTAERDVRPYSATRPILIGGTVGDARVGKGPRKQANRAPRHESCMRALSIRQPFAETFSSRQAFFLACCSVPPVCASRQTQAFLDFLDREVLHLDSGVRVREG